MDQVEVVHEDKVEEAVVEEVVGEEVVGEEVVGEEEDSAIVVGVVVVQGEADEGKNEQIFLSQETRSICRRFISKYTTRFFSKLFIAVF